MTQILNDSAFIFKNLGLLSLQCRSLCFQAQIEFHYKKQYQDAKKYIEDARRLSQKTKNIEMITTCNSLLNNIQEQIIIQSNNVFVFSKAFPLVEYVEGSEKAQMVGTFTRYYSDFRI